LIGKIVTYTEYLSQVSQPIYKAIVIDHRDGYHVRESWSSKTKFVDCPMIKIYWLTEPHIKPPSALRRMSLDWNMNPQYSFGFAKKTNNYVIEEWDDFKSGWYYMDIFEVEDNVL
jgi:hypothetical protein